MEALAEAGGEFIQGEGAQPGRGEFDGQRQPVKRLADRGHARVSVPLAVSVAVSVSVFAAVFAAAGADGAGAVEEQPDRERGAQRWHGTAPPR
ncbi:hypothetical protein GCM10018793_59460 [Streptomyces sulfonofaciens]|uniref:Uncharacterized protein n=1 Tax=Streptomyces sulfonofaciens TaxID=68272 RepID=A0A919GKV0_9ACTN|nr:hypothetical protein GCM10018793_59460 [Streptomyces sulfonofaciens]